MNRINKLFQEKNQGLLSLYFCAGHPTLESTVDIIKAIQRKGIDFIELELLAWEKERVIGFIFLPRSN